MFKTISSSKRSIVSSLSIITLAVSLTACGGGTPTDTAASPEASPAEGGTGTETAAAPELKPPLEGNVSLTGAGASFPAPLYQNWFVQLNKEVPQLQVNYQSVGSGAGVEQFTAGTVDFGASDVAMKDEEIAKVTKGVLMLPVTAGSIVFAYNLPGVEGLKLSREAYVGIFDGSITKWNDPKIAAANPGVTLPDEAITVVHRSDGSGTTGVFTKHLSTISKEWETAIGQGKSVEWPTSKGKFIGAKGNEGVTASIQQNQGSIGYVEYGYAKNNDLTMAVLENAAGKFVEPSDAAASATLDAVTLPEDLRAFITDPEGEASYPIVTYSWLLVPKTFDDPQKAIAMEAMIQYALTTGQDQSAALGYVPLPPSVREKVAAAADVISPDFQIKLN
ncbi:phosphate ABC transporter substrate-binding protein PstS [Crocosphaera sp. XPORK-15E]|uniref:phosphate ABC transporter substrate-binding protein PstS n=1 Tax=Crocosphaera sp. XPORK-15E TaxID=3110247 RepID=UPI002B204AFE|nr:phosphate ABC transporter substrate-binding protein PstS [Crocosphaera sp. XPORK-15E]MEA5535549.1 phosphate ABC transporter substrate-binding protein PstS [Crocosphaera sp. XPORK-15E]